jgi:hypothetical protein
MAGSTVWWLDAAIDLLTRAVSHAYKWYLPSSGLQVIVFMGPGTATPEWLLQRLMKLQLGLPVESYPMAKYL